MDAHGIHLCRRQMVVKLRLATSAEVGMVRCCLKLYGLYANRASTDFGCSKEKDAGEKP